ncbi:MAG: type III-B CRISPR module RAMP protein Cmr4 [Bacteroidales bacterium]
MYRKFQPFFIIAETPVHAGSGSELGIVDLPIQRERYTNFPKIEGSGLKGCIREAFENSTKKVKFNSTEVNANDKSLISLVFGPEDGDEHAGAIAFTDARVLLFPVKSLKGVFAWITCPMVLNRFVEDMKIAGMREEFENWDLTNVEKTIPNQSNILVSGKVVLEEFTFEVKENQETEKIAEKLSEIIFPNETVYNYWKEKLKKDLVILSNDEFENFVTYSTEVITRTKISTETGTVLPGALWTEEYLPQDTILYSIAMTTAVRVDEKKKDKGQFKGNSSDDEAENVMKFFKEGLPEVLHLGGNQTIGKGIVSVKILEAKK